jgi:hypothetical protein
MHLYPALKYFTKYGVMDKDYQKFMPLFQFENLPSDQPIKHRLSKAQLK